jgi:ABC-type glutathione transport system ATPase component
MTTTTTDLTSDLVLEVDDYRGGFTDHETGEFAEVLRGVSIGFRRSAITAVVGETGSGKTMLALSMIGLAGRDFRRTGGSIRFDGTDLCTLGETELRRLRGRRIAMVFQDSVGALNPVFTIGRQLKDVCRLHHDLDRRALEQKAVDLLTSVRIAEPRTLLGRYPHEISGGMAQRVQLALALACEPDLLLLDEPTTGLDVTIQAEILELIVDIVGARDMSAILITHDLGVVASTCDDVVVMRGGEVCESGSCRDVFSAPRHPYTTELLTAAREEAITHA